MMPKTLNLDALVDSFGAGNHRENKLAFQKPEQVERQVVSFRQMGLEPAAPREQGKNIATHLGGKPCNDSFRKKCLTVSTYP